MKVVVGRDGLRLDRLIADNTGCGRRRASELLRAGLVRLDGRPASASTRPLRGQVVEVIETQPQPAVAPAAVDPVRVLARVGDLLALAKPAGLHTQHGRSGGSVAEFLEQSFEGVAQVGNRPDEAGTVHRLDKDTSGVLLAALTRDAYARLRRAFAAGRAHKEYVALVAGPVGGPLEMDAALASRGRRVVVAGRHDRGRPASTRAVALENGPTWSLVHVRMSTGVRHQVRVHLAAAGHPLIGDELYGGPTAVVRSGHLLHAWRIRIEDELDVTAPFPGDFVGALAELRRAAD